MKKNNNLFTRLSIWLIKNVWQKSLGVCYNKKRRIICRFYPTCSEYAVLALNKYGLVKGISSSINRLKRCTVENTDSCIDYPDLTGGGDKI